METTMDVTTARYVAPTRSDRVFNALVRVLVRRGVSVWGARELRVRGRKSGKTRTTVVNLLDVDGTQYLVAPRGTTEWVRNLRAAGGGDLAVGRRVEPFQARELDDHEKLPVLRAYLDRWAFEVGRFFDGLSAESPDDDLRAAAAGFPAFEVGVSGRR
jgi:deazaflavin-dependent oxidoreductase (nitroreductase family)